MQRSESEGGGEAEEGGPRWGAFSYPSYRRFWIASVARVFGLQFRFIGMGWLVISDDGLNLPPVWFGVVGLATSLPTILGSLPAGVLADRYDHARILVLGQSGTAVLSLLLAGLILTDRVNIGILIAWSLAIGVLAAIVTPAQGAILPRLIEPRSMSSAVALLSSIWNTMRIVGPAGAGVLIAWIGIGQAFLVTAAGFALSAVLVATLRLEPLDRDAGSGSGDGMMEGVRYIAAHPIFAATIGLSFFTSVFGMSYQVLLPVFADDLLDVGSEGFGIMESAVGVGGFLGTLSVIKFGASRRAGAIMLSAAGVFGLFMVGFAASETLPWAAALLFCAGFCSSVYLNIGMTTLQLLVPDGLRGRVMGIWSMTWFLSAVGGLPAGALAQWIGPRWTVALGSLSVSVFALAMFMFASQLRRLPAPVLRAREA